jgi:hypothetical protein
MIACCGNSCIWIMCVKNITPHTCSYYKTLTSQSNPKNINENQFYGYPIFCIALGIHLEVQWHTYFSIQFQTILAIHQSLYHDVPTHSSHVHITVPQVPIFTSGHLSWGWARASHVDTSQMTSFAWDGDYGMLGHSLIMLC